jgi:protein-S-isoprenylcysteine O-methyltransferase Ste14
MTQSPGTKNTAGVVPPPLIALVASLAGLGLDWLAGTGWLASIAAQWRLPAAFVLFAMGAQAGLRAILAFRAAGTEVEPWKPSTALATASIYRRTRNPMYQAIVLVVLALALWLASDGMLVMVPVLAAILHLHVVRREEAYLERMFGADYLAFKTAVPRYGWPV